MRHLHLLWLWELGIQTKLCTTSGATWKGIRNGFSPGVLETLGKNLIPVCVQDPCEAKNIKAGSCSMIDPIKLVGVQEVEHFSPSFGGTSLTPVESLLRWNDSRCSFACFLISHIPLLFFEKRKKKWSSVWSQEDIIHPELSLPFPVILHKWNRKLGNMYMNCTREEDKTAPMNYRNYEQF